MSTGKTAQYCQCNSKKDQATNKQCTIQPLETLEARGGHIGLLARRLKSLRLDFSTSERIFPAGNYEKSTFQGPMEHNSFKKHNNNRGYFQD